jgi:hypothetical protein
VTFGVRRQSAAATALWRSLRRNALENLQGRWPCPHQSGVALRLPPHSKTIEDPMECAGRARRRRRFGSALEERSGKTARTLAVPTPKRGRATLATAVQNHRRPHGVRRQSAAATALWFALEEGAGKFARTLAVPTPKRCRATLATAVQNHHGPHGVRRQSAAATALWFALEEGAGKFARTLAVPTPERCRATLATALQKHRGPHGVRRQSAAATFPDSTAVGLGKPPSITSPRAGRAGIQYETCPF